MYFRNQQKNISIKRRKEFRIPRNGKVKDSLQELLLVLSIVGFEICNYHIIKHKDLLETDLP